MHAAVITVWIIGLIGALIPTIVILKLGMLVIAALRDILKLSVFTAEATARIADHVAPIASIPDLSSAGDGLVRAARHACSLLHSVEKQLETR
jgi:hypothetical protein